MLNIRKKHAHFVEKKNVIEENGLKKTAHFLLVYVKEVNNIYLFNNKNK